MKLLCTVWGLMAVLVSGACGAGAEGPAAPLYTIPSWGDFAVVYGEGTDPAMDSPEAMEHMFAFWKARGFTGVFLRSDLQQYAPFVQPNARVQNNPALALMWRHVDVLASRFDYFTAAAAAARRTGLEFWMYHPHIYSEGAPPEVGTPGPGRMMPWSYVSKVLLEHPEMVSIDRQGNRYWMVPEYAYPEARRAKVAEFVHMARRYGIRHFIANMRTEVNQLIDPADKADRYGFNAPVVEEMRRRYGVDLLTDPRFDVDAPTFDPQEALVEKWRDLRGEYLTQLWRELRTALREVDPGITVAVTLAGEHIGPPLGNWRTDWRTWVQEGLVDALISPVFFEATLDHEAEKKGYLTNVRTGLGTVPHETLRAYIRQSAHPEIRVIATGGAAYFLTPSPVPAGADGMQCDAWFGAYHLAWAQRWAQWQRDLREFGYIRFIEQNFDEVSAEKRAMPSGGWGELAYNPRRRACGGAWWRLGDGSDARPYAQSAVKRGASGQAMRLTQAAVGGNTLTGFHNTSPDRSKFAGALDTSMTSGRATFECWVRRESAESGVAAYLQGDPSEMEVGVRVAAGEGVLWYLASPGKWVATGQTLPVGEWRKLTLEVEIDRLRYGARTGEGEALCAEVPLAPPKPRTIELPGVNLPIRVPAFKEFRSVLFVPEGGPGSVTLVDDVAVRWQPAMVFAEPGPTVELSEDFEAWTGQTPEGSWVRTAGEGAYFVTSDTSYGRGVHSLRVAGGVTLAARRALPAGRGLTVDLDVLARSSERLPSLIPNPAARSMHTITLAVRDAGGNTIGGLMAREGTWRKYEGEGWSDTHVPVHHDVWNHLQLVLDGAGGFHAGVQPVGQVAAELGHTRTRRVAGELSFTIETSGPAGDALCVDNVRITSAAARGGVSSGARGRQSFE